MPEQPRSDVRKPILVTGATGRQGGTGRAAAAYFLKRGRSVRALVRSIDERAEALRDLGMEIVVGDYSNYRSLVGSSTTLNLHISATPLPQALREGFLPAEFFQAPEKQQFALSESGLETGDKLAAKYATYHCWRLFSRIFRCKGDQQTKLPSGPTNGEGQRHRRRLKSLPQYPPIPQP